MTTLCPASLGFATWRWGGFGFFWQFLATFGKPEGLKTCPWQFVTTWYHSCFHTSSGLGGDSGRTNRQTDKQTNRQTDAVTDIYTNSSKIYIVEVCFFTDKPFYGLPHVIDESNKIWYDMSVWIIPHNNLTTLTDCLVNSFVRIVNLVWFINHMW